MDSSRSKVRMTLREMDHPSHSDENCWSRSAEELVLLTLITEGLAISQSSIIECYTVYYQSPNELPPYDNVSALSSYYAFHYSKCDDIPETINKAKRDYNDNIDRVDNYEEAVSS